MNSTMGYQKSSHGLSTNSYRKNATLGGLGSSRGYVGSKSIGSVGGSRDKQDLRDWERKGQQKRRNAKENIMPTPHRVTMVHYAKENIMPTPHRVTMVHYAGIERRYVCDDNTSGTQIFKFDVIIECRRLLKCTYAYGYYLSDQELAKKEFFLFLQGSVVHLISGNDFLAILVNFLLVRLKNHNSKVGRHSPKQTELPNPNINDVGKKHTNSSIRELTNKKFQTFSLALLKQVSSSKVSLLKYCYEYKESTSSNITDSLCLRLNNLSLSRIGSFERLLWAQNLDLSHNQLHSIEGLEALQLLSCLNLSHNKLSSFTALDALRFLKSSLKVLDISYNEIDRMFVKANKERTDPLKAVIIGAKRPPYHHALFFFDVYEPCGFPYIPHFSLV
ncbi:geranylgeranyl transferase type-2 subunit alpha 1 [Tanacetum coccineum]